VIARPAAPRQAAIALVTAFSLAACTTTAPVVVQQPAPVSAPELDLPVVTAPVVTMASAQAMMHYERVQQQLLSQGLLRTDGGGRDTPYTDRMLAENFIRIALYDEYSTAGGPIQRMTESRLRRWEGPVRVALRFGPATPPDRRAADTARVASFLQRLSRVTGHPIALNDSNPNFFIHMVTEDERRALGPQIRAVLPGLSASEVAAITDMPRSTYCLVYAMSAPDGATYTRAFAVIRAEPDRPPLHLQR